MKGSRNLKKIILFDVPTHENIGDAAILIAEEKFIRENLQEYEYIKILDTETEKGIEKVKETITNKDIILLQGGGNLGDEYMLCENRRRMVMKAFPDNRIIVMPQTMYFNDTQKGKKELEETKRIYNNHKYLTLVARENVSFNIMKKEFPKVNVILTPDIVMYLNETKDEKRRDVLLAMRQDIEKTLTRESMEKIKSQVLKNFNSMTITDTHLGDVQIEDKMREKILEEKLAEFRKAQLVITDRLHGMIFAAITSTPCIALGNYNHKIEASFEWLKNQEYIKFLKNLNDLESTIKELMSEVNYCYNNEFARKEYQKILDVIQKVEEV